MQPFFRAAAALIFLLGLPAAAAPAPKAPVSRAVDLAAFDAAVQRARAAGLTGEALLTDARATIYDRAFDGPGRPHRPGEPWRWASVTKQVTATLALQTVAEGRLDLDAPLARALPGFAGPTAERVTVRMLLNHTSGLPNPDDVSTAGPDAFPDFYRRREPGVGGPRDAFGFCAGPPRAEPGAGFSYDNCDYIVLGAVLERIWGRPYAHLVRDRIARPLKLKGLGLAQGAEPSLRLARAVGPGGAPEPDFNLATFGPAGALYGPAEALAGFDRGLLGHRLVDAGTQARGWAGDPALGYAALGVWAFKARLAGCAEPVRLIERRGEIGGVQARNLLAPEAGLALVVFVDRPDFEFGEIWRGEGAAYDLASAAFCSGGPAPGP